MSSFCCPAFGGQTSLLSGAQVLQTPQTNLLQCPLHLCVQLLLPGIWRSMFSFLPINFFSSIALCTYVSSFCCPVFGGKCFFSPQYFFLQCPLLFVSSSRCPAFVGQCFLFSPVLPFALLCFSSFDLLCVYTFQSIM